MYDSVGAADYCPKSHCPNGHCPKEQCWADIRSCSIAALAVCRRGARVHVPCVTIACYGLKNDRPALGEMVIERHGLTDRRLGAEPCWGLYHRCPDCGREACSV